MSEEVAGTRLIDLGKVVGTHGVRGELRFHPYNADSVSLSIGSTVTLHRSDSASCAFVVRGARPHGRLVLVCLDGVTTIDAARALVGNEFAIPESDLPTPEPGQYYCYQLEGLDVVTVAGDHLGTVTHLMPTGSNEVMVVCGETGEHLIPVIADVIREVDLHHRRVVIEPIAGLLE